MDSNIATSGVTVKSRILLASEFSLYPMGRSAEDGDDNGQRFFVEFLLPNLTASNPITIVFDGVHAFGSSFLDEAFFVMPVKHGISGKELKQLISIEAKGRAYSFYKKMAEKFMDKVANAESH